MRNPREFIHRDTSSRRPGFHELIWRMRKILLGRSAGPGSLTMTQALAEVKAYRTSGHASERLERCVDLLAHWKAVSTHASVPLKLDWPSAEPL